MLIRCILYVLCCIFYWISLQNFNLLKATNTRIRKNIHNLCRQVTHPHWHSRGVPGLSALTTLGQIVSFDDNPSPSIGDVNADSALRFFRTRPVTVLDSLGFSVNFFVVFTTPNLSLQIGLNAVVHSAGTASEPSHVILLSLIILVPTMTGTSLL